jgi:outer membrane protein assembly factor BamA
MPNYVGYPGLVRGYYISPYSDDGCVPDALGRCQRDGQLQGSRMLVANIELRMPVLRPLGLSRGMYGPLPVEAVLFADAGAAWNRGQRPSLAAAGQRAITSAGVAARANLGMGVVEIAACRPFERPGEGWVFHVNLAPGF